MGPFCIFSLWEKRRERREGGRKVGRLMVNRGKQQGQVGRRGPSKLGGKLLWVGGGGRSLAERNLYPGPNLESFESANV